MAVFCLSAGPKAERSMLGTGRGRKVGRKQALKQADREGRGTKGHAAWTELGPLHVGAGADAWEGARSLSSRRASEAHDSVMRKAGEAGRPLTGEVIPDKGRPARRSC